MPYRYAFYLIFATFLFFLLNIVSQREQPKQPVNNNTFSLTSDARKGLDFLQLARSYPAKDIADQGWSAAYYFLKRDKSPKTQTPDEHWRPIGPVNIGGRTLSLAINPINPQTIYAGSASGGLWRSHTGGSGDLAWEYIPTGHPVLGVAAIAIHPIDTNIIYIGTGEVYGSPESYPGIFQRTTRGSYGIGILQSTDNGQSWKSCLDWRLEQRRAVQKLLLNPRRPETVWAATTEGTYRSFNGGKTWQLIFSLPMVTDIEINPLDTNIVFLAIGGMGSEGHGIYRTINGGESWLRMDLGSDGPTRYFGKAILAMSSSSPNIVMASIGNSDGSDLLPEKTWLCRTTDSGDHWEVVSVVDYSMFQGWYAHTLAIHPQNPDTVWAAGVDSYPFLSYRGGKGLFSTRENNWFQPSIGPYGRVYPNLNRWADYHDIVYHPHDPQIIYFINDGGIFRTLNGGRTTENCNSGYQTTQFYNGFSNSLLDSTIATGGLQDNNSVLYMGLPNWKRVGTGDGGWTVIAGRELILSAQGLYLLRYQELGEGNISNISPPNRVKPNFISPLVASPVNPQHLYGGTSFLHTSIDLGKTWNRFPVNGRPIACMDASHQNENVLYLATIPGDSQKAGVFRTANGGLTYEQLSDLNLPDRYPTDITIDPINDDRAFITFGGFGTPHVYKTENQGQSWTELSNGLPDLPAWSVAVDPQIPAHLYVGNDIGVFQSLDGGISWSAIPNGLPDAVIAMDLKISPLHRKLRMATHGHGAWERTLEDPATVANRSTPQEVIQLNAYPNPLENSLTIEFELPKRSDIRLEIVNIKGQVMHVFLRNEQLYGHQKIIGQVSNLPRGTYLLRLRTQEYEYVKKLVKIN